MRPVDVFLPNAARLKLRLAFTEASAVAGSLAGDIVGLNSKKFVFVAVGSDCCIIAGSSTTITDPVASSVAGASRPTTLPRGVHIPYTIDASNCYFEFIAPSAPSGTAYLEVYEA